MNNTSTVDHLEVAKFAQHASVWWDINGPLKTLHDINPVRLAWILQFGSLSGKTVLDIGCGGGILSEVMAKSGGIVTGLDVEVDAIAKARDHALQSNCSIEYVAEPLETYRSHEAGVFDVITCMEMLEHVAEPSLIIQHAQRLLKPDGLLLLSTINRTLKAYLIAIVGAEYVLNILPRQTHDYDKFIQPSELAAMARAAGLEVCAINGMGYNPLTRKAFLQPSVAVNYLLACRNLST